MTQYDPDRPGDPRDPPGVWRSDDPLNPPHRSPEPVIHDAAPVRNEDEARQATPGRPVLVVLLAALVLALIAWGAVELYPRGGQTTAQAPARDVTGSPPRNAGGIPLSPPPGSPEGATQQGQTGPDAAGRGQTSAPSPTSDSAR